MIDNSTNLKISNASILFNQILTKKLFRNPSIALKLAAIVDKVSINDFDVKLFDRPKFLSLKDENDLRFLSSKDKSDLLKILINKIPDRPFITNNNQE